MPSPIKIFGMRFAGRIVYKRVFTPLCYPRILLRIHWTQKLLRHQPQPQRLLPLLRLQPILQLLALLLEFAVLGLQRSAHLLVLLVSEVKFKRLLEERCLQDKACRPIQVLQHRLRVFREDLLANN